VDSRETSHLYCATIMKQRQENRVSMFEAVAAYMDDHKDKWSGKPAVVKAVADLNAGIAFINAKTGRQGTPLHGITTSKDQVRTAFEDKIVEVADQIAAYAAETKDAQLAALVEVSRSG